MSRLTFTGPLLTVRPARQDVILQRRMTTSAQSGYYVSECLSHIFQILENSRTCDEKVFRPPLQ